MILHVSLGNYGPFRDSGEVALEPGLNVIAGLNNTGKTALLWALFALRSGPFPPDPTWNDSGRLRDQITGYVREGREPWLRLRWDPGDAERERVRLAAESAWGRRGLPSPKFLEVVATWRGGPELGLWLQALLLNGPGAAPALVLGRDPGQPDLEPLAGARVPGEQVLKSLGLAPVGAGGPLLFRALAADLAGVPWPRVTLGSQILAASRRIPDYNANVAVAESLAPDASNLAAVLHTLVSTTKARRNGRDVFDEIAKRLRAFFPELTAARAEMAAAQGGGVPTVALATDLGPLTVPVGHCGTGVWNTLAILTAALLPAEPRLILIDEPSAFLHPAAERELARFLEEVGKEKVHIFVVASHSVILASHARDRLWATVRQADGSCRVERLGAFARALSTLGVTAGDILPHEGVLLVEGPSDRSVFRSLADETPEGRRVAVVALGGDGRARVKGGRNICEVVKRAMDAAIQIKMPVVALLDSVNWSDSDKAELGKNGNIALLEKPEIEDYFLNAEALAAVLAEDSGRTPDDLRPKMAEALERPVGHKKGSEAISSAFHSAAGVGYDKVAHLPRLLAATPADDCKLGKLREELAGALARIRGAVAPARQPAS